MVCSEKPLSRMQVKQLKRQASQDDSADKLPAPGASAAETGGAYYRKYILQDLAPWAEHGITKVRAWA